MALFLVYYASLIRFVRFTEAHDARFEARLVETTLVADYARDWLAWAINPLLMGLGLVRRNYFLFLLGPPGRCCCSRPSGCGSGW